MSRGGNIQGVAHLQNQNYLVTESLKCSLKSNDWPLELLYLCFCYYSVIIQAISFDSQFTVYIGPSRQSNHPSMHNHPGYSWVIVYVGRFDCYFGAIIQQTALENVLINVVPRGVAYATWLGFTNSIYCDVILPCIDVKKYLIQCRCVP